MPAGTCARSRVHTAAALQPAGLSNKHSSNNSRWILPPRPAGGSPCEYQQRRRLRTAAAPFSPGPATAPAPGASTEGRLTKHVNNTGVRFWTA